MALARTILAVLIAASLAILPVRPAAADTAPGGMGMSADMMSADALTDASTAMDDCCPGNCKPCDMTVDQCKSMAACAYQSSSIATISLAEFVYPPLRAQTASAGADNAIRPPAIRPPVPPPRI